MSWDDDRFELVDCEDTILREIADPQMHQRDVSQTYRMILESTERDRVDWAKVNGAIVARWSRSGLLRIKTQAWSGKCFAPREELTR